MKFSYWKRWARYGVLLVCGSVFSGLAHAEDATEAESAEPSLSTDVSVDLVSAYIF